MKLLKWVMVLTMAGLSGCASQSTQSDSDDGRNSSRDMMIQLMGKAPPKPDIQAIQRHALGSKGNPVRVNGPKGENQYFERLACPSGESVEYERLGSAGTGPYGFILDQFKIVCENGLEKDIYVDMYHVENLETKAVEPFIVADN